MMVAGKSAVPPDVEFVDIDWSGRPVRIETRWVGVQDKAAPVMVFLHEGLGSLSMWRDFPDTLCSRIGFRGLVYSRPGYGWSTPRAADEQWGTDFMHQQADVVLPALLSALQVDTAKQAPWLFGHSDGGSIALLAAMHRPHDVAGLIVLAPHIFVEDVAIESIAKARDAYLLGDLRQRLARHHQDPDSAFWGWNDIWLHPGFGPWRIDGALGNIGGPLLAVQGLDDEYGTLAQIRGIAAKVPQCELLELAQCGHSPHRDQPERLIDAIAIFLKQQPQGDIL
jgi:pimeloyl-ACP methyl ester carboxylesterase